jgi:hypothetical protein
MSAQKVKPGGALPGEGLKCPFSAHKGAQWSKSRVKGERNDHYQHTVQSEPILQAKCQPPNIPALSNDRTRSIFIDCQWRGRHQSWSKEPFIANVPHCGPCEAVLASTPHAHCSQCGLCLMAMPPLTTSLGPFMVKTQCLFVDNTLMLQRVRRYASDNGCWTWFCQRLAAMYLLLDGIPLHACHSITPIVHRLYHLFPGISPTVIFIRTIRTSTSTTIGGNITPGNLAVQRRHQAID